MATTRRARAQWSGSLREGSGTVDLSSSGLGTYDVSWASRANDAPGRTSPEELLAAAHAACFSMALSNGISSAGHSVDQLDVTADVTFQPGEGITGIRLTVVGRSPGLSVEEFGRLADDAKANCPVSRALAGAPITLDASLAAT